MFFFGTRFEGRPAARDRYGRGDWRFAGAHSTRRDFGGAAFGSVPDRDEATGLELELADGVEMM